MLRIRVPANAVIGASTQTIDANLFTNTNTFYNATVTTGASNISANLLTNTSTIYNATVTRGAVNINAALLSNTNTFYNATITQGFVITPNLLSNSNTFYNATITRGAVNITAQLLTNSSVIYLPTIARADSTIVALRLNNTSAIYLPSLAGGDATALDTSDILTKPGKKRKRYKTEEELEEENVAAQILKARQGTKTTYKEPKQILDFNLKARLESDQPIANIVNEIALQVAPTIPFTSQMRHEIAGILESYQLKLKQQRRAKQLQALMLLATMDD